MNRLLLRGFTFGFVVLFLLILKQYSPGLEVAIDEIRTKPVKFINYQGPYKKSDSPQAIEQIGRALARTPSNNISMFSNKYSMIHAISKNEPNKFSATIFSINKQARVGHIAIIRKILSSYLQQKYGYTKHHAEAIALFLTYYNAAYRGDIDYFSLKYKSIVMIYINKYNAGISTKYYEWPGNTRMLIPLTEEPQKGKLDAIVVDVISNKDIVKEVRKDDKNINARKDMVDLKKQIITNEKTEVEQSKTILDEDIKKLSDTKKALENDKTELQQKEKEIRKTKEVLKTISDSEKQKTMQKEIETKEKQLDHDKQEVKKKEEKIEKKESEISKQKDQISTKDKKLEQKQKDLEKEEEQIAFDEAKQTSNNKQELIAKLEAKEKQLDEREDKLRTKEVDKSIYADKLFYLKIKEYLQDGHYNNEMIMIDPSLRKILFKSPELNICGSKYDIFSKGVVVITHKGSHSIGHRLTLLDRNTLEPIIYGNDNIFWRSFIIIKDDTIFAIVIDNGKFYLGKFDTNLVLISKSSEEVNENTFISFWNNYIYINSRDKTIMVLDNKTLQLIDSIKP